VTDKASYNQGKVNERVKMYDEELVKEIMLSTALCVHEMLRDDPQARVDDIYEFVESNFHQLIDETLTAEREDQERPTEDPPISG
jgi:hypothetical protein